MRLRQIPEDSAVRPASALTSGKAGKHGHISFSSASAESEKRKSRSLMIGAKSSEDDDDLIGLNIPTKK